MTAYVRAYCVDNGGTEFWRYACENHDRTCWVMRSGYLGPTGRGHNVQKTPSDSTEHGPGTAAEARAFVEALAAEHPELKVTVEGSGYAPYAAKPRPDLVGPSSEGRPARLRRLTSTR